MTQRLILQVALITVEEERLVKLRSNLSWINLGAGGGCHGEMQLARIPSNNVFRYMFGGYFLVGPCLRIHGDQF